MRDEINHGWFAAHGYVSIRVDMPGTGNSEGFLSDEYRPKEHAEIAEVLAWIARQEWCDGNVGMFGHSWGGYSGLQMAALNPPELKAVVASGCSDDLYGEDCHFRGGVMEIEHLSWAATMLSFFSRPPDPEIFGDDWKEKWINRLDKIEWILPKWLQHPTRDAHWKYPSICENFAAVNIPILLGSGWADTGSNGVLRMAENLPDTFRTVVGPWAHKFPHMGMPKPAIGWLQECVKWWDHWLKGVENDIEKTPRLRFFIPENVLPETVSDSDRNGRWASESEWPAPSVSTERYTLGDGLLGQTAEDHQLIINSPQSLGTATGELMPMGWGADLPGDQRQDDGQSLIFDTPVITEGFDIFGRTTVELTLSSDKPVAFVFGRLCDVAPDGTSYRVCYGALNLTHTSNHGEVVYLEPGKPFKATLILDDVAHRFCTGHRLRLALSNAYWPLFWPAPEAGKLTVYTKDSALHIPLRKQGNQPEPSFEDAAVHPHLPRTVLEEARSERTHSHDLATGQHQYRVMDWASKERSEQSGLISSGSTERIYTIKDDDPTACTFVSKRHVVLERNEMKLETCSEVSVSCTKTDFQIAASLMAWDGEENIIDRSWKDIVPRIGN